jgi:hypothetical protein
MSPKEGKRVLKSAASSVFVGRCAGRSPFALRLDARDDGDGNRQLFAKRKRPSFERGRPKLFHYISAGGMRQLRRTSADDVLECRRRSFLLFLGVLAAVWLVFYFVPCA